MICEEQGGLVVGSMMAMHRGGDGERSEGYEILWILRKYIKEKCWSNNDDRKEIGTML